MYVFSEIKHKILEIEVSIHCFDDEITPTLPSID